MKNIIIITFIVYSFVLMIIALSEKTKTEIQISEIESKIMKEKFKTELNDLDNLMVRVNNLKIEENKEIGKILIEEENKKNNSIIKSLKRK